MSQRTLEEYLESIGELEETENPVSTSAIAQSMGLSPASVSEMLRRLAEKGLVDYAPYGGARLTEEGRRQFLRLTRRHRLWEVFLNRHLGIGWEDVYQHACTLEHATSELVEKKLDEFLGNPEVCPHGRPIPRKRSRPAHHAGIPLSNLEIGQSASVLNVFGEGNSEFLNYLTSLGLFPGTVLKVLDKASYDGTLTVEIGDSSRAIGHDSASMIMVAPV